MSDELDKNSPPQASDEGTEDVEAHKLAIGKNAPPGATDDGDDENDVEAHKYSV